MVGNSGDMDRKKGCVRPKQEDLVEIKVYESLYYRCRAGIVGIPFKPSAETICQEAVCELKVNGVT